MKGEKETFSVYYALLLHEREKHSWNTEKDLCCVWRRCVIDWPYQKLFTKLCAKDFSLDDEVVG